MKKIVINNCYGGFGLSGAALSRLQTLGVDTVIKMHTIKRDDPLLIKVVEELGIEASGAYANLVIVEIPDDVEWEVEEYDGNEWVAEKHRTWGR